MRRVVPALLIALTPVTVIASPIYALTNDPGATGISSDDRLIKIDSDSGNFETIGRPGQGFDAISFDGNGNLLAADDTNIYSLDTETAASTNIGQYRDFFNLQRDSLKVLTEGESNVYGLGGFATHTLQTVDPDTGTTGTPAELRPRNNDDARRAFDLSGGASYNEEDGRIYVSTSGIDNSELYSFSTDVQTDSFGDDFVDGNLLGELEIDFSDGGIADSEQILFTDEGLLAVDNNGIFGIDLSTLEGSLISDLMDSAGDPYAVAFNGGGEFMPPGDGDMGDDGDNGDGGVIDPEPPVNDVPAPSSFALFLLALSGMAGVQYRRKKQ